MPVKNTLKDITEFGKEILSDDSTKGEIFRKTFSKCTTDKQRIKILMWSHYKNTKVTFESASAKDKVKCLQYKEEGNALYKKKEFGAAIRSYNQSLAHAPVGRSAGPEAAIAYANRSAVLYQLGRYEACLQDVARSVQVGYPAQDQYKLSDRRTKCFSRLGRVEEARAAHQEALRMVEFSRLEGKEKRLWMRRLEAEVTKAAEKEAAKAAAKAAREEEEESDEEEDKDSDAEEVDEYGIHQGKNKEVFDSIPRGWRSDCLKVETTEEKGRILVATRDIKVGEVMIHEKTPVCVLADQYYSQFCYHCLKLLLNPLPCPVCVRVFFCSDRCRDTALPRYHLEECMSLPQYAANTDTRGQLPTIPQVALRALLTMAPGEMDRAETLGVGEDTPEVSVHTLMSHNNDRELQQQLMFSLVALQGALTLKGSPYWSKLRRRREEKDSELIILVATFLLHFLGATVCNSFQVSCYQFAGKRDFRETELSYIGVCLCPFIDMSNHSCNPSADVEFYSSNCVVTATRTLRAGDEVNVDYGPHYSESPRDVRQAELRDKFFFTCTCEPCEAKWPTVEGMEAREGRFRCEVCREEITAPPAEDGMLSCSACPHVQSMHAICEVLAESHEAYKHVMSKTKMAGVETLLLVLEQHVTLLDYWMCQPWKDYANCQATLKQVYRCMGNHYYLKDKLW